MAKRKQAKAESVSATLPKGTVVYGTQEVIDRVSRRTGTAPRSASSTRTRATKSTDDTK